MHFRNWNLFLIVVFVFISVLVIFAGNYYKNIRFQASLDKQYSRMAGNLTKQLEIFIKEKQNATLTIGLSLAQNNAFKDAIIQRKDLHTALSDFSRKLSQDTEFKNVWIQLIDNKGKVLGRSWTIKQDSEKKIGHNLSLFIDNPKVTSFIGVDENDLSFRSIVPFFDDTNKYIGHLEVITHFNSIAKKINEQGYKAIVVVDKAYKSQITQPFTKHFIGQYYIANKDVDDEVLEYIQQQGIEHIVDYKQDYTIDKKDKYFKVNYTLFDAGKKPLAYIIMFKKAENIDISAVSNMSFIIYLFMAISILSVAIVSFLLSDKKGAYKNSSNQKRRYFIFFAAIFILVSLLYYILLSLYKDAEEKKYLKTYNSNIKKDYRILLKKFESVADSMFATILNNEEVIELMQKAYTKDKAQAREELFNLLKGEYEYFKQYNIRQLHFHLKDNESFLRFHRPEKYGDNLTGVRSTVEWVNTNNRKIKGFEEGRIYNGFRYVFPLSYTNLQHEKVHIGSVEASFSANAIASDFADSHDAKVGFIIDKKVVDSKVFKQELSNYTQSDFQNFYYESDINKQLEVSFKHFDITKFSQKQIALVDTIVHKGKIVTMPSNDARTLITIIPFRNPVTNKVVAALILEVEDSMAIKQNEFFTLLFGAGELLILFTTIFMYREYTQKINFLELSRKTQHILDSQKSIVVITDSKNVFDANKKFLDFFGYNTLNEFKLEYDCICDFFLEDENYFHLGKVPPDTTWIDQLNFIAEKDRIVLMHDKNGIEYSFTVTASSYNEAYYIVSFVDISGTMQEQFMLEKRVAHDKLTGAYNRDFFETHIEKIKRDNHVSGNFLGMILFDIDYFKGVNDTYGHNIGDSVLKELTTRVGESIRGSDYLIRWGGEEFIVLLSVKSLTEAKSSAEHLRSMLEHHQFEYVTKLTCSFGVTLYRGNEPISQTVGRADKALYESKKNGRNLVTLL